jgi:hypothetical protein
MLDARRIGQASTFERYLPITLGREEFSDKVPACWMGKNIGGTLGAPWECITWTHALEYYEPVPYGSAPNDDLDLQLVRLKMLEGLSTGPCRHRDH